MTKTSSPVALSSPVIAALLVPARGQVSVDSRARRCGLPHGPQLPERLDLVQMVLVQQVPPDAGGIGMPLADLDGLRRRHDPVARGVEGGPRQVRLDALMVVYPHHPRRV